MAVLCVSLNLKNVGLLKYCLQWLPLVFRQADGHKSLHVKLVALERGGKGMKKPEEQKSQFSRP